MWSASRIDSPIANIRWATYDWRLAEYGTAARPSAGQARSGDGSTCLRWRDAAATVHDCESDANIVDLTANGAILLGAISDTGRYVALMDEAGGIAVFDTATALPVYEAVGGKDFVALSEKAALAAHATSGGRLVVAPLTTGSADVPLSHDGDVGWAQFSPSGGRLLTSPDGTLLIVHDLESGAVLGRYAHDRRVSKVMWLEDSRYFASVSEDDGTARIWDVELDEVVLRWHLKTNLYSADIGVSADGRIFVFVGQEHGNEIAGAAHHARQALWRPADLIEAACYAVNRNLSEEEWSRYFSPDVPYRESCVFE